MTLPSVSVIIPSYNRFDFLCNAIESVKNQEYKNIEIVVIDDGSTEESYKDMLQDEILKVVKLPVNQKQIYGFGPGSIRNFGVEVAKGEYIAFLDDDDMWMENKLEEQISQMVDTGFKFSSTEALYGAGLYNPKQSYELYNAEKYFKDLKYKFRKTKFLKNGFPSTWNYDFIKIHNCFITSTVIVEKNLLNTLGGFRNLPRSADYDCWLGLLKFTDSLYIDKPLTYYDSKHGLGRNYHK